MSRCVSTTRNLICTLSYSDVSGRGEDIQEGVFPLDCSEVAESGPSASGRYLIKPTGMTQSFEVYCDMSTDGGNWTVLQRREDGLVRFNRTWMDYKFGFGDVLSEHWLGNEKIYHLTTQRDYELRVELGDFEGDEAFAIYKSFNIDSEIIKYRLHVSNYSGTAGDSLGTHNGYLFSALDQDNDLYAFHCAKHLYGSAWWFGKCLVANLNGRYFWNVSPNVSDVYGISWYHWKGNYYSMKRAEMKIRPLRP
ncbi:techylectin-5A-like [Diadema setosum]|uniref:techylectin-5A-like n=1 Tax=Diadema setosum TaxID=31175 RepID=UPI003B3AAEA8